MMEFAGSLRERIVIERPSEARSAMGLQVAGWDDVARCLAAVEPDGAGNEREAMALSAMPRFKVSIRLREGVAIDQITSRFTVFNIIDHTFVFALPSLMNRLTAVSQYQLGDEAKAFMEMASKVAGRISQENMRSRQPVVNNPAAAGGAAHAAR